MTLLLRALPPFTLSAPFTMWLRFCVAYATLNAPHWLLSHWFFVSRPMFNVELVVPLLVAAWPWRAAIPALGVLWAFDLAVSQSRSYWFASPQEFLASARFLSDIHLGQFLSLEHMMMALPFGASIALALWLIPRGRMPWAPACVVVIILSVLDVVNGSSMAWQPGTRLISANLANAPVTTLAVGAWNDRPPSPLIPLASYASATAVANLTGWTAGHPDGSVLVVIVESMGWHVDAGMRSWLREQLFDPSLKERYQLQEASVPFRGSTTSAELRELCHLHGSYKSLDATTASPCLPSKLRAMGWTTVGLHGFSSHMFDRTTWWPLLGLQRQRFAEELATPEGPRCGGAFAGVCDAALLEVAVTEARLPRQFVYALTLNSHLPLAPIEVPTKLRNHCQAARTGDDVCMLTAALGVALRALKLSLSRTDASPEVIVVGDHAPPFGALAERNQFDQAQVPAFILEPR